MENSTIRDEFKRDGYSQEDRAVFEHEKATAAEKMNADSDMKSGAICPCCGAQVADDFGDEAGVTCCEGAKRVETKSGE